MGAPRPAWLTWNDGTVLRLARAIAEERNYGALPVLADALEEAGCTDAAILGHCRSGGRDVRCSWVVDPHLTSAAPYRSITFTLELLFISGSLLLAWGSLRQPVPPRLLLPAVLTWNNATVVRLAQAAYEERHLPDGTLDNGRLAVLADALEEAGCRDQDILSHYRSGGEHVRGCWVVDLLLGKT